MGIQIYIPKKQYSNYRHGQFKRFKFLRQKIFFDLLHILVEKYEQQTSQFLFNFVCRQIDDQTVKQNINVNSIYGNLYSWDPSPGADPAFSVTGAKFRTSDK